MLWFLFCGETEIFLRFLMRKTAFLALEKVLWGSINRREMLIFSMVGACPVLGHNEKALISSIVSPRVEKERLSK